MAPRRFKLFVPSGYAYPLHVSGKTGAMPDVRLMNFFRNSLQRSRLPNMDQLIFTFGIVAGVERVLNFYHVDEFFLISGRVKELFVHRFRDELETTPIRILHQDGKSASDSYWAARPNKVIDCIDAKTSTWSHFLSNKTLHSFAEGLVQYDLDERCWDEFSNDGQGKYKSYHSRFETKCIQLIDNRIPADTLFFQPKYWPGHWVIERDFARELEQVCAGGARGNYFWTLDLDDVRDSYHQMLQDLR